jgi:hypothetical protein
VRPRTDLALVMWLALAACLFAALIPSSLAVLRVPLCLPLVLALPGYALVTAAFQPRDLRTAELVTLSVAFSITATMIAGLLLELFRVRLTTAPWMALLTVFTFAAAWWGNARGHTRPLAVRAPSVRRAQVGALAVALALLAGAAVLGFTPLAAPKGTQGTSVLWLVPAPHGRNAVCVGVINEQLHDTTYEVSVSVARKLPQQFGPITLAPGASWSRVIPLVLRRPLVNASLSTTANPSVSYRSAVLRDWDIGAARC